MISPTSLPSGNELRDACVRALLTDSISVRLLDTVLRSKSYRRLLPERVLQDVGTFASDAVDRLMAQLLGDARSNSVHAYIAQNYVDVFTTNFDLCLDACRTASVRHLHGAISSPQSLQNRMFRLGRTASREIEHFKRSATGKRLVIVGYSLRDRDIVQALQSAKPSDICYLTFDGSLPELLRESAVDLYYAMGDAAGLFRTTASSRPARTVSTPLTKLRVPVQRRACAFIHLLHSAGFYDEIGPTLATYLPRLRGRGKYKAISYVIDALRVS
jgi:hypothetical protein